MLVITFPDGSKKSFDCYVSPLDVSRSISLSLANSCLAGFSNGKLIHALDLIKENTNLHIVTTNDSISIKIIRKTCVYLLGYAIKKIFPYAKMVNGSIINKKFYYDIDIDHILTKHELNNIEQLMRDFITDNFTIFKKNVTLPTAVSIFSKRNENYKVSILNKIKNHNDCTLYYHQKYIDIFQGIQAPNTKFCQYFKLYKNTSGIFWKKSNGKRKILQRIYGIVLENENKFYSHLQVVKIDKNRDHRMIGKKLDLYHIQKEIPGMIFWHNNGYVIFRELQNFVRIQLQKFNYQEVYTPFMLNRFLWEKTGHWENYAANMFSTFSENKEYCIKPMNCPGHVQIFKHNLRSYRDLPFRIAEFGCCHRNEPSGSLYGLMRLRNFTQDDAHIFCEKKQIKNEIINCIKMIYDVYAIFGFNKIIVKLSTKPSKYIGNDDIWNYMEENLVTILLENNIEFQYNPGKGAFYGPKIEFSFFDCFNREWQCGTIQLDCFLPYRLGAFYINKKNEKIAPIMIHRAIFGSIERFIAILTEEFSGRYPTWLSPIQVVIMNITEKHTQYVIKIKKIFSYTNIRTIEDIRNKKINFKIREHTLQEIPYMLICGDEEVQNNTVSVRTRCGKYVKNMNLNKFIKNLNKEIINKTLNIQGGEILKGEKK
ncbi:MAG: threonine--tRNA ligase [Candidatus Westeberhardia cardiocondylae]|nr:threonine--tRNA ligase [Candidatus Westeberhardia cardiocondylae]